MKVFIASPYEDSQIAGEERHLAIRRALWEEGTRRGHEMFIAEYSHPALNRDTPWRRTIDTCVGGISGADLFIALLLRRWGGSIAVDDHGLSATSFLEIELFQAAIRHIPVFFLVAEDFQPEPELARLITILRTVTRPAQWIGIPERGLKATALELIDGVAAGEAWGAPIASLTDRLSDDRSFRHIPDELRSNKLSLLDRFAPTRERGRFSEARFAALLAEARQMASTGALNYADLLSRPWIALRELSKVNSGSLDPAMIAGWVELAELWRGPAAWLRLHGPLNLGVLAALQTQADLASRSNTVPMSPFGAFASEAYSIGKISTTKRWRTRRFRAAQLLATQQAEGSDDPSGAWLIRGSATFQLARLGRPWLLFAAHADYVAALRHRERSAASSSAVGEALVELAFAEFQVGRFWRRAQALAKLREGVRLLEADEPERRPSFVKRAKSKLVMALDEQGYREEAEAQRTALAKFNATHGLPTG